MNNNIQQDKQVIYTMKAPDSVKDIADVFKKNLEKKIKLKKDSDNSDKAITLVFFPIVSRTGTDIDATIRDIKDNKPAILVALHHTFDPECVVSDSSKFVERENTLAVDCLFFEDKGLLECKRNEKAYDVVVKWLKSQKSRPQQEKSAKKGTDDSNEQKQLKSRGNKTKISKMCTIL